MRKTLYLMILMMKKNLFPSRIKSSNPRLVHHQLLMLKRGTLIRLLLTRRLLLIRLLLTRRKLTLNLTPVMMKRTSSKSQSTKPVARKSPRSGQMLSTFGKELSILDQ